MNLEPLDLDPTDRSGGYLWLRLRNAGMGTMADRNWGLFLGVEYTLSELCRTVERGLGEWRNTRVWEP